MMLIMPIFENTTICLGKSGGNLAQIAKRINKTRSIYQTDMDVMKEKMNRLWKVHNAMKNAAFERGIDVKQTDPEIRARYA